VNCVHLVNLPCTFKLWRSNAVLIVVIKETFELCVCVFIVAYLHCVHSARVYTKHIPQKETLLKLCYLVGNLSQNTTQRESRTCMAIQEFLDSHTNPTLSPSRFSMKISYQPIPNYNNTWNVDIIWSFKEAMSTAYRYTLPCYYRNNTRWQYIPNCNSMSHHTVKAIVHSQARNVNTQRDLCTGAC
jgi:hypothetical protein